jgi:hypothetical protein
MAAPSILKAGARATSLERGAGVVSQAAAPNGCDHRSKHTTPFDKAFETKSFKAQTDPLPSGGHSQFAFARFEFGTITFVAHFPNGFGFSNPGSGWEYPLTWGLIVFAVSLRGGGPYSLDRLIGREI